MGAPRVAAQGEDRTVALTLHYASGSPYAWRVWLALEHKRVPYELKLLSFDKGDLATPAFRALNPRGRVPVLEDEGFALYESAAIVEYIEDKHPGEPRLFASDIRERALQRRLVREADQYFADALERLVTAVLFTKPEERSPERIARTCEDLRKELAFWETALTGDWLAGPLSAADFTLYPELALVLRMASRNPGLIPADLMGEKVAAWVRRMEALPIVQKTWPPHWK
jgi:glutathione S-transferase